MSKRVLVTDLRKLEDIMQQQGLTKNELQAVLSLSTNPYDVSIARNAGADAWKMVIRLPAGEVYIAMERGGIKTWRTLEGAIAFAVANFGTSSEMLIEYDSKLTFFARRKNEANTP